MEKMVSVRKLCGLAAILLLPSCAHDRPWEKVQRSPTDKTGAASGVIQGSDEFDFTYRVRLPEFVSEGRLWLPLAKSDAFQTVEVETITSPAAWRKVQEPQNGNVILTLPTGRQESGSPIEIKYHVVRREKSTYRAKDADPTRYLKPERLVPQNQTFRTLALETTQGKRGDLERGRALYDHVLQRMRYNKSGTGWGRGDAMYACDARAGNCSDFHAYFIALARSIGIPARFAIGATIPADSQEGKISGYHCWAEFLAKGKWVPVDISEASKNPALADYYFGHHPANRFELSAGRDLVIDPGPASGPINFLVYPLLEVDGKTVDVQTEFSFKRTKKSAKGCTRAASLRSILVF